MEHLSFNTKIGYDDIQNQFEYLMSKQRDTIKLLCNGNFGIVSDVNTSLESSSLVPSIEGNSLNFTKGQLVTKEGNFAETEVFSVTIPQISEDTIVLYSYELRGSQAKRISNSGKAYSIFYDLKPVSQSIRFLTLAAYNNLTSQVLSNSICLAVIKYASDSLTLDLTTSQYSFNRPWFSLCDIAHRTLLGTGSSDVPHSIGLNDLSSRNLTLYDQLTTRGLIVSKDYGIAGIPGTLYENNTDFVIEEATFDDGEKMLVVDLKNCYPNSIGSVSIDGYGDVACHLMKSKNFIVIDEVKYFEKSTGYNHYEDMKEALIGSTVNLQLCVTNTLMLVDEGNSVNELTFKAQSENDTIITQGLQVTLNDTNVSFKDCSKFNKHFEIVVNKDGTIHKEPEILNPLDNINALKDEPFSQEFDIPVRIQVMRTGESNEDDATFTISGIDENGNEISDSIVLSMLGSNVSNLTKKMFSKVTRIRNNAPDSNINVVVFAYADRPRDRRVRIASADWNKDSQKFENLKDNRPISTIVRDPFKISVVKEAAKNVINSINVYADSTKAKPILIEDFSCPEYLDLNTVTWITANKGMNFPLIPKYITSSKTYVSCYRSRKLKLKDIITSADTDDKIIRLYAYLVDADLETINSFPVRLILENSELVFDNLGNGLFSTTTTAEFGKILVSGVASGISVFSYPYI